MTVQLCQDTRQLSCGSLKKYRKRGIFHDDLFSRIGIKISRTFTREIAVHELNFHEPREIRENKVS